MSEEVASGKSKTASKAKNTYEETENMISLWSEEEVLFLLLLRRSKLVGSKIPEVGTEIHTSRNKLCPSYRRGWKIA